MPIPARLFLRTVIIPAISYLEDRHDVPFFAYETAYQARADAMLLAIAMQESNLEHRVQKGAGGKELPHLARGWWQCERAGCAGAVSHSANDWLVEALSNVGVPPMASNLHDLVRDVDMIAVWVARSLLWALPGPLPAVDVADEEEAWRQYIAAWRPGKPRREAWPANWRTACEVVREFYGISAAEEVPVA